MIALDLPRSIERAAMRTPGVEPGSQAWGACMMPLHYVRSSWLQMGPKHRNRSGLHTVEGDEYEEINQACGIIRSHRAGWQYKSLDMITNTRLAVHRSNSSNTFNRRRNMELAMALAVITGTWRSGITSASHAEGLGFKSQCVHLAVCSCSCGRAHVVDGARMPLH